MKRCLSRAGPTTAFGRVVGDNKFCAELLCNIVVNIIMLYIHI